jgi:signal transduction histidine kinase
LNSKEEEMVDLSKCKVLVVDDSEASIEILLEILGPDYDIHIAMDGEAALKNVADEEPDLILLDVMMPGMSGYEVCEKLKKDPLSQNIPVIFLTSMNDSGYETKAFELGAVDYISKPFHIGVVKKRVKHQLEREGYKKHLEQLVEERTLELRKAKDKLQVANKAKGDFLMNMSHELRTPLNGVLMAAELILFSDTKKELKELQDIISSSGNSLLKTIEQILDFTRSKNGELELESSFFRLDEALSKIKTSFFHNGTDIKININFDFNDESVPNMFMGDEGRLIEIINHLLENAAKFTITPPEATIKIKVKEQSSEDVLLEFSLTDRGIGISEDSFEKIFEPFSQVDTSSSRQYAGLGIGLTICRQFVELMNGKIGLKSELGKGSTFFFTVRLKR